MARRYSWFPIKLATFARPQYGDFPPRDYRALGVPHELTRPIDADGQHYQALVLIGPAASASERAAIEAVIASLTFPPLYTGEQAGDETVLGLASRYPIGSFTLIHAPAELCDGSVYRGRARMSWAATGPCHLRFDSQDEQFYCTNSQARWDRTGSVIRMPRGARFADGLQLAFAKVAWDGHVVFLPGLGGNPPRAKARALLWPPRA